MKNVFHNVPSDQLACRFLLLSNYYVTRYNKTTCCNYTKCVGCIVASAFIKFL